MEDLTLESFAYLRIPLFAAALAFLIGALGTLRTTGQRAFLAAALMMVLFFQAARLALIVFDPYLSSRPLAEALLRSPEGKLIVDRHYYAFSSVFFYTNRPALLLNGLVLGNFVYGASAPGAPDVFLDDAEFRNLWLTQERCYLVAFQSQLPRLESLVGRAKLNVVAVSGGKFVATNQPLPGSRLPETAAIKHGRSSEAARLTAEELAEKIRNAGSSWAEEGAPFKARIAVDVASAGSKRQIAGFPDLW
jgi:hypothetical protein